MVRLLVSADVEAFRALRLEGLRASPAAFGAHVDEEDKLPLAEFARRIEPTERSFVLGAFDEDGTLRGLTGWYRERGEKSAHKSVLWGAYVQPSHRHQGFGSALLGALLERVEGISGLRQIQLHVVAGNREAKALYAKFGFRYVALLPESLYVEGRYLDEELWIRWLP